MIIAIAILATLAIAAAWDAFRRWVDATRFNQKVLDQIAQNEREIVALREQVQTTMSKVQAQQAAVASRAPMSRIGR